MYIIIPEEKKKLKRIFKPYLEGGHLNEDATQEAIEAFNEFYKLFDEELGLEQ